MLCSNTLEITLNESLNIFETQLMEVFPTGSPMLTVGGIDTSMDPLTTEPWLVLHYAGGTVRCKGTLEDLRKFYKYDPIDDLFMRFRTSYGDIYISRNHVFTFDAFAYQELTRILLLNGTHRIVNHSLEECRKMLRGEA